MNQYGQLITWSTPDAPHASAGVCDSWSDRNQNQRFTDEDESGDIRAVLYHGKKNDWSFSARVTDDSTDFLDLSSGAQLATLTGFTGGCILARRATERWSLGASKTISVDGTFYPDFTDTGAAVGSATAFTPTQTFALLFPSANLIWSTGGITHASGIVHGLEITQEWEFSEMDELPDGTIPGVIAHAFKRNISLDILSLDDPPATGTGLAFTDGPDNSAGFLIESVETKFAIKRGKMYAVQGFWTPAID